MKTLFVGLLVLAVGCGKPAETPTAPPPLAEPAPVAGTATIAGKVLFTGDVPKPTLIKMAADPYCASAHDATVPNEELLINTNGTLRNVFVYVRDGLTGTYPPPTTPAVLDQAGCLYRPRVQGLQVGQPLIIRNSDDTLHNVHALGDKNPAFNLGQPVRGMEQKKMFTQPEVMLRFKCDVHPWMTAYLGIVNHPFHATTGDGGTFSLSALPAGKYVVEAWHEKLGTRTQTIELAAGETKTVEFTFTP
ncbi:MAG: carboxypeptidase regulatory-like domain-containing protein [Verrucomicrobiota bacterium]